MSFNAVRENKILTKTLEFTVIENHETKQMLWELKRTVSMRRFFGEP